MSHPKSLIAYYYIKNVGFFESEYLLHDSEDFDNPIYKIVVSANNLIPKYERLKSLHLTKKSIIEKHIKSQRETVDILEANLESEKQALTILEGYADGEHIDFQILDKV